MFLLASILCINILGCSHTETKDNINPASTPATSENTSEYVDNKNQETSEPENIKDINQDKRMNKQIVNITSFC